MTGIVRLGDAVTTHHLCTSSSTIVKVGGRTDTVFVNDIAVALVGDATPNHSYTSAGRGSCNVFHTITFSSGSGSVYAYDIALLRINDTTSGEELTGGSGSVTAD